MPTFQRSTTYENAGDVLRGSAAISVSPFQAVPSWSAIGAHVGCTLTRDLQTTEEQVNDAQTDTTLFSDEWDVSFDRVEILTKTINEMLYSFDSFIDVAGTLVSSATQTVASGSWSYNKFILIENQNGDGSAITVNSVNGGTDGLLVADTDYYVGQNESGEYGIYIIDSVNLTTESQSITIDYDYTPDAKYQQTNDTTVSAMPSVMLRFQFDNDNGKQEQYVFYKCQATTVGEISPASDNDEDRRLVESMTFRAKADGTYNSDAVYLREVGDSLF